MYRVADDMERIIMMSEMQLGWYTRDDIEYMKTQLMQTRELISEGAAASLYTSSKTIIAKVTAEYQMRLDMQNPPYTVTEKEKIIIYNTIRRNIKGIFLAYKRGNIEKYMFEKVWDIYGKVLTSLHAE